MPLTFRRLFTVSMLLALCPLAGAPARARTAEEDAASIRQHRMGILFITSAPGARVRVEQLRHEFWFGAALANQAFDGTMPKKDVTRYREAFLANFNSAVTENAVKWLRMERERGRMNYATVDAILEWTDAHDIPLRGHNIYWGIEQFVQPWLKTLNDEELRATLEARGRDIGRRYRGRFVEYDLNNEMIHGNYYAERLGPRITLDMARWVLAEDPDAKLFLNDYDILTGAWLDKYIAQIRELREMGVPLAGIGVQGHLHAETFDREALRRSLDELAQFNLGIRVTEFNVPGQRSIYHREGLKRDLTPAEEAEKAREIVDYYRICFAHPAVTGILMWGFWEGANWIPQSSLFKRDWTPTPAARAYHDLIYTEWWTQWEGTADADGHVEVPAFFGTHRVRNGRKKADVVLRSDTKTASVALR